MWQYCVIVAQSCLTLCNPSPPIPWLLCPWNSPDKNIGVGSHSLLQARGSFQPRDWTCVSCIAGRFFYHLSHQESPQDSIKLRFFLFVTFQFSSVTQSCPTLCDPMNHSMPGLPVHHQFPEFTQTHVHRVGDAIQPSHPLSSPSPPAPNPSPHQGLFQWVNSLHEVTKLLEFVETHKKTCY